MQIFNVVFQFPAIIQVSMKPFVCIMKENFENYWRDLPSSPYPPPGCYGTAYSQYSDVKICSHPYFFTHAVHLALVLDSCCSCSTRDALVLRLCCTRVALVWHSVAKQTRSKIAYFLRNLWNSRINNWELLGLRIIIFWGFVYVGTCTTHPRFFY